MSKYTKSIIVVLVTTTTESGHNRGLTVSSFTTLSLADEESPLVCFNIRLPSGTSAALHETKRFAVNFLESKAEHAQLALSFAGGLKAEENQASAMDKATEELFTSDDNTFELHNGLPVLKDAMAIFFCRSQQVVSVQDHEIWIGNVERVASSKKQAGTGLLYRNKQFRRLHDHILE